ncbi:MAG: hypothetical protein JW703_04830 [Candidatus Diapherotrites archaeon]|nr:hypothetical protein [Candidatus Diapherotrites archaeon]
MNSVEAEEIRKKKLEELKQKQSETETAMQMENAVDSLLREILEPEAKERLSRVRMINQQRYSQVAGALIQLNKAGRLEKKINDEELKQLLEKLSSKKEITIKRK